MLYIGSAFSPLSPIVIEELKRVLRQVVRLRVLCRYCGTKIATIIRTARVVSRLAIEY